MKSPEFGVRGLGSARLPDPLLAGQGAMPVSIVQVLFSPVCCVSVGVSVFMDCG